jgi:hypothetical protein
MTSKLVKNQHTFPAKSISRFCNGNGLVSVFRKENQKIFSAKPNNQIFCYERVWDQRAEQGFGKEIEDRYQEMVESVLDRNNFVLPINGHEIATRFFSLWYFRATIQNYDEDMVTVALTPTILTGDQKLALELKHYSYTDEKGDVPLHMKRGRSIQMALDQFASKYSFLKWHFSIFPVQIVIPDNPINDFIIPISSHLCLIANYNVPKMPRDQAIRFNLNAIVRSKQYYFANDLAKCIYA